MSSQNLLARSNSRAEVCFILNKIIIQLVFMFTTDQWVLVLTLLAASSCLAYYYFYDDAYYDRNVAQFYKVMSGIYLWSCLMLFLLKVF